MKVKLDAEVPPPTGEVFKDSDELKILRSNESRCACGHGLYSHYMCGGPSRCLTGCGCGCFKPSTSI